MAADTTLQIVLKARDDASRSLEGLSKAIGQLQDQAQEASGSFTTFGKKVESIGQTLDEFSGKAIGLGTKLVGIGTVIGGLLLKNVGDFESEIARAGAFVKASAEELDGFRESAIKAAEGTRFSKTEVAKALGSFVGGEISAQEATQELGDVINFALIARLNDLNDAVNISSTALIQFQKEGITMKDVMDSMSVVASNVTTETEAFARTFGDVSASTKSVGLTFKDTNVLISELVAGGARLSTIGSAINSALINVSAGGDQAASAFEAVGLSIGGAQKALQGGTVEFLSYLKEGFDKASRSGQGFEFLVNAIGRQAAPEFGQAMNLTSERLQEVAGYFDDTAGASDDMVERIRNSQSVLDKLKNAIEEVSTTIGQQLLPIVTPMIDRIVEISKQLAVWIKNNQETVAWMIKVGGVLSFVVGPAMIFIGILSSIASKTMAAISMIQKLIVALRALQVALAPLAAFAVVITVALIGAGQVMASLRALKKEVGMQIESESAAQDVLQQGIKKNHELLKDDNSEVQKLGKLKQQLLTELTKNGVSERTRAIQEEMNKQKEIINKSGVMSFPKPATAGVVLGDSTQKSAEQVAKELEDQFNKATSGLGGGGGGPRLDFDGKKASEKAKALKEDLKKLAESFLDLSNTGQISLTDLAAEHTEKITEMEKKLSGLNEEYKTVSDEGSKSIQKLKDENVQNLAQINKSIGDVQNKMSDLRRDFGRQEASDIKSLAEAFVGQEQKIESLRQRLREETSADKIVQIKQDLAKEESALKESAMRGEQISDAITEARRRAGLTDLQRAVEDFDIKRSLASQEFSEKMSNLEQELTALTNKRQVEKTQFAERLLEVQTELTKKLEGIDKERKELLLQKEQEQQLYKEKAEFISLILQGAEDVRRKAILDTKKLTEEAINAEIAMYDKLVQAIRKAASETNRSTLGVLQQQTKTQVLGQRADGGMIPQTGPYLLHEGEYVLPADEVSRQQSGLFPALAGAGVNVNIYGGTYLSEDAAEKMGDMIIQKLKENMKL